MSTYRKRAIMRILWACSRLGIALLLTAALSPLWSVDATEYCATGEPSSILRCYSQAHAEQDSIAFARLLAPDYAHTTLEIHPEPFGRDRMLASFGASLRRLEGKPSSIVFGEEYVVEPDSTPNSWFIRRVFLEVCQGHPVSAPRLEFWVDFGVRLVDYPAPHYEIYMQERAWIRPDCR